MAVTDKFWRIRRQDQIIIDKLRKETGFSDLMCRVCFNRGLRDGIEVKRFVNANLADYSGCDLHGVPEAVKRIAKALATNEKIVIYGDYDVDGITATALMIKVLTDLGVTSSNLDYYIPERQNEGYGLNSDALNFIVTEKKAGLVITVDCGISGYDEVRDCDNSVDIIITDHHQPPEILPDAFAIVNPKLDCCCYESQSLAGVGVALKLCQALCAFYGVDHWRKYLDIAAIGTIADMVPLTGENRAIVKTGLRELANTSNIGLKALCAVSGITDGVPVTTDNVGFGLAPRLNAAGRLSQATLSVELLLTEDASRAEQIAQDLNNENIERRGVEQRIFEQADALIKSSGCDKDRVIVLSASGWHSGVIGIVASRLVGKYYRPVIVISENDRVGKGSCRSIQSFNLYEALSKCSDLLTGYGGHYFAAGLTIDVDKIILLRERLNAIAADVLEATDYFQELCIDAEINLSDVTIDECRKLQRLEPYGIGNSRPLFALRKIDCAQNKVAPKKIGRDKDKRHLKISFEFSKTKRMDALCWDMADSQELIECAKHISLAVGLETNVWRDTENVQLKGVSIIDEESFVDRDALIKCYSGLKARAAGQREVILDENQIDALVAEALFVTRNKFLMALRIFSETGLLSYDWKENRLVCSFSVVPQNGFDLSVSATYIYSCRQKMLLENDEINGGNHESV